MRPANYFGDNIVVVKILVYLSWLCWRSITQSIIRYSSGYCSSRNIANKEIFTNLIDSLKYSYLTKQKLTRHFMSTKIYHQNSTGHWTIHQGSINTRIGIYDKLRLIKRTTSYQEIPYIHWALKHTTKVSGINYESEHQTSEWPIVCCGNDAKALKRMSTLYNYG